MKKLTLSLTALLLALWPAFASAETPAFVPLNPAAVNKKLDAAATKLNSGKAGKEEIAAILQEVAGIEDDRQQTRQQYAEELASVQKKQNALGPAPEKDESEPAAIAKQRKEFAGKADGYKAQIAQMDLLAARIDEINGLILKIRNRRLLDNILVKQSSIFHPEEFWQSLTTFAGFVFELVKSPFSWYRGLPPEKEAAVNNNILTVIGVMAGALVAAFFLSRYIRSRLGYRTAVEHPDYSQKVRAGIAMFIVRGVIPAAVIGVFLFWLKGNGVVNTGSFGLLLHTAAVYLLYYYLTKAAVRTVFTHCACSASPPTTIFRSACGTHFSSAPELAARWNADVAQFTAVTPCWSSACSKNSGSAKNFFSRITHVAPSFSVWYRSLQEVSK